MSQNISWLYSRTYSSMEDLWTRTSFQISFVWWRILLYAFSEKLCTLEAYQNLTKCFLQWKTYRFLCTIAYPGLRQVMLDLINSIGYLLHTIHQSVSCIAIIFIILIIFAMFSNWSLLFSGLDEINECNKVPLENILLRNGFIESETYFQIYKECSWKIIQSLRGCVTHPGLILHLILFNTESWTNDRVSKLLEKQRIKVGNIVVHMQKWSSAIEF